MLSPWRFCSNKLYLGLLNNLSTSYLISFLLKISQSSKVYDTLFQDGSIYGK